MKAILISTSATATSEPNNLYDRAQVRTYQATIVGTDAQAGTVIIEGSNDLIAYVPIGTITLSGTTSATDGFASYAPWEHVRARITAISGTGALITVSMGA